MNIPTLRDQPLLPLTTLTQWSGAFSHSVPGWQLHWDSTSYSAFCTCPKYYELTYIQGITLRHRSVHLAFGIAWHSAMERFHRLRATGYDYDQALLWTIAETYYRQLRTPEEKLQHQGFHEESVPTGPLSHTPEKTPATLIQAIIQYLAYYKNDDLFTVILPSGKAAVELSFAIELPTGDDEVAATYRGHLDRLVSKHKPLDFSQETLPEKPWSFWASDYKAQPISSLILTKEGWKTIERLAVGEEIATADGSFTAVTALHSKGKTKIYKLTYNDGFYSRCAEDHLWAVYVNYDYAHGIKVLDFKTILDNYERIPYSIPLTDAVDFPEKALPLHPYLLGALIGDGYLAHRSVVQFSAADSCFATTVLQYIPVGDRWRKGSDKNTQWNISGGHTLKALKDLNLYGCKAATKFIPRLYQFASINQRKMLLQGLLDTDGCKYRSSQLYDTISPRLAEDVCALVHSLGGNARMREVTSNGKFHSYRLSIRLPWVTTTSARKIVKIERVLDEEAVCIEVAHPSKLYLTEYYTVTHNTTTQALNERYFSQFTPDVQMTGYTLATKTMLPELGKGVVVDGVQMLVTGARFGRSYITRSPTALTEFLTDLQTNIHVARYYAITGAWPMNRKACRREGRDCEFRFYCANPNSRQGILLSDFTRSRIWDPTKER